MRKASVAIALVALLATATLAFAQAQPAGQIGQQNNEEQSITGTVESVDANLLVINATSGRRMYFTLQQTTDKPDMLQAGDRVEVFFHPGDNGERDVATRVVAQDETIDEANISADVSADVNADANAVAEDEPMAAAEERNLPRTASNLPLLALLGGLSLLGAAGLSLAARS